MSDYHDLLEKLTLDMLWMSNSPEFMPTGYGNQTGLFVPRLKKPGQDNIIIAAFRGFEGMAWRNADGVLELPRSRDGYMNDIIDSHIKVHHRDLVISLIDVFALRTEVWGPLPWAAWNPVDCTPVLPHEMEQLDACRWPIAMSRFGQREMEAIDLKPLYVPHGIDSREYYPMSKEDRVQCRRLIEVLGHLQVPDDKFLIVVVAANGEGIPSRKRFSSMFRAFQAFNDIHPDSFMYLHTDPEGIHGEPLRKMALAYDLQGKVAFAPSYDMAVGNIKSDWLNQIYNAADLFMLLSGGEGFGIPIMEAQMAGCPVIVTNFSAMAELCLSGWRVDFHLEEHYPMSHQAWPDIEDAVQQMCAAYDVWKAGNMQGYRDKARREALAYDIDTVMHDHMLPALLTIQDELRAGKSRARKPMLPKPKPPLPGQVKLSDKAIASAMVDYEKKFKK